MIKYCKVCGRRFEVEYGPRKCCSKECMSENVKIASHEAYIRRKNALKPQKKRSNQEAIVDLTVEARKNGMSYGQYVAQMYMGRG